MKNQKTFQYRFAPACLLLALLAGGAQAQDASRYNNLSGIGGTDCSAFGDNSLANNTSSGADNAALGKNALYSNTSGSRNTAVGANALYNNTGDDNTAIGHKCLYSNTSGINNTAVGKEALYTNTTGNDNTALGYQALYSSTTDNNSAMGVFADVNSSYSNQTAIGAFSYPSSSTTGNVVTLGDASIVLIETAGSFLSSSDRRIKDNVTESPYSGLDFINRLRPVVYNLDVKKATANSVAALPASRQAIYVNRDFSEALAMRRSGFIAQEVEAAAARCGFEFSGLKKPVGANGTYGLMYAQFVMPLVKAVQEQQKMIDALQAGIKSQQQLLAAPAVVSNGPANKTTGIAKLSARDNGFSMAANRPNPFSSETVIDFNLPAEIHSAVLTVSDLSGKQVLSYPITERGTSSMTVTAEKLAPGIYVYAITGDGKSLGAKRMVVSAR